MDLHLTPITFHPSSHPQTPSLLLLFSLSLPLLHSHQPHPPMKLSTKNLKLSPTRLFRSSSKKKNRSAPSMSDPPSFGSGSSSEGSIHKSPSSSAARAGSATPTSVLPDTVSGDWSDVDLSQAFRLIDRDNDGVVSRQELEAVLSRLAALRPEEVAVMLSEVDAEGRGCIDLDALVSRVGSGIGDPAEEIREAFEVFDSDGDGRISAEELLRVFRAIGDERCTLEECRRMIEGVDRNGDGFVCFDDFARMMELQQQHQR